MKDVRPVIVSKRVSYFQVRSVGSHKTSGREKEGKEETYLNTLYLMWLESLIKTLFV